MTSSPQHFHLLAKPTGAVCNLDCRYCFFLSKEMLYPGSRFRMADDLLETYKAFFTHIDGPVRLMAGLLRQGRYADESMAMLRTGATLAPVAQSEGTM